MTSIVCRAHTLQVPWATQLPTLSCVAVPAYTSRTPHKSRVQAWARNARQHHNSNTTCFFLNTHTHTRARRTPQPQRRITHRRRLRTRRVQEAMLAHSKPNRKQPKADLKTPCEHTTPRLWRERQSPTHSTARKCGAKPNITGKNGGPTPTPLGAYRCNKTPGDTPLTSADSSSKPAASGTVQCRFVLALGCPRGHCRQTLVAPATIKDAPHPTTARMWHAKLPKCAPNVPCQCP